MDIIIIDHYSRTIYSTLYTLPDTFFLGRLLSGIDSKRKRSKLEYEISKRGSGDMRTYQRRPLSCQYWYHLPDTTAIVERTINLIYIDIVGDIINYVE